MGIDLNDGTSLNWDKDDGATVVEIQGDRHVNDDGMT